MENELARIREAIAANIPYLGIWLGLSLTNTEYAVSLGCTSKNVTVTKDNQSNSFTLAAVHGVPSNTNIEMNSWPKEIALKSDEQNITRKIAIEEHEECYKKMVNFFAPSYNRVLAVRFV